MNKKIYLGFVFFIITLACVLRVDSFYSHHFYLVPDEAHSLAGMKESFTYLFTRFDQGANFLPFYKSILKIIYDIVGFNVPYFKIPSLISCILSVFVFFDLSRKVFKNEIIVLCSLVAFALNYNLIYYSSQVKPYAIDALLCLIIINFAVTFKDKVLSIKNLIWMLIISSMFIYTSIPSVVVIHLCLGWMFISNKKNRVKLLICEACILSVLFCEYFTYISQIQADNSLKSMWTDDSFFFSPKSLDAVNSLVNFSYFNFFWWDTHCPVRFPKFYLIGYLVIFFVGCTNFLREKFLGLLIVSPVLFFLILSYLNIYPFCNRLIVFLIPLFILITFKAFDYEKNKYIGIVFSIILTVFGIYCVKQFSSYNFLVIQSKEYYEQISKYIIPLNNISDDEYIISTGSPYWRCLETENIYRMQNFYLPDDIDLSGKCKIYFAFNLIDDKQDDVDKFMNFLEKQGFEKTYAFDKDEPLRYQVFEKNSRNN